LSRRILGLQQQAAQDKDEADKDSREVSLEMNKNKNAAPLLML